MASGNMRRKEYEVDPEQLRCRRSDGKRWRCSAMSVRDNNLCERHYFQAKRRYANLANNLRQKKIKRDEGGEALSENRKNEVEKQQVSEQEFSTVHVTKKSKSKGLAYAAPHIRLGHPQPQLLNEEAEMDKLRNHGAEKEPDVQLYKVHTTRSKTKTAKDLTTRPLLDCSSKSTGTEGETESTMCQDEAGTSGAGIEEGGFSGAADTVEARFEDVVTSRSDSGAMAFGGEDDVFKADDILAQEQNQMQTNLAALERECQSWKDRAVQLEVQVATVEAERVQWQVERAGLQVQVLQYQAQLTSLQQDRDSMATETDGAMAQMKHLQLAVDQLSEDIQWEASRAAYYQSQLRRHAPSVQVQSFSEYKCSQRSS